MPLINRCGGGGGGPSTPQPSGDYRVRFIDYDGTILKETYVDNGGSVTPPSDPSHDGLTFEGWNYASSAFVNITSDLDVGTMYITSDGKTKMHIRPTTASGLSPTLYLSKSDTSTLLIDWGDGNTDQNTDSGNISISHPYAAVGDYSISLTITSGNGTYGFGDEVSKGVLGEWTPYTDILWDLNIGNNVTSIGNYAFSVCRCMESLTIPSSVTSIGDSAFAMCTSLKSLSIPSDVTSLARTTFSACMSLENILLPSGITSIMNSTFRECYALKSLLIPSGVTSLPELIFGMCISLESLLIPSGVTNIGQSAFTACYKNLKYIVTPITPPVCEADAFSGIFSNGKIYVPDASVTAYKTATNWATYANYIYPLSDLED